MLPIHIAMLLILHFNKKKFPIMSPSVLIMSMLSLHEMSIAVPLFGLVEL